MRWLNWQAVLLLGMGLAITLAIGVWSVMRNSETAPKPNLNLIRSEKTLTILTRNAPTTYFEGRNGPDGFEYQLTQAFAEYMGVSVHYRFLDTVDDILSAIQAGQGDIAAAGITHLPQREGIGLFTPSYMDVRQQLICHRNIQLPRRPEDLVGLNIRVSARTSYVLTLNRLQTTLAQLNWQTTESLSTEQIFNLIIKGDVDCTIADSNIVAINQRFHPKLMVAMDLTSAQPLAWLLPVRSTALHAVLNHWFELIKKNGQLQDIYESNYGHIKAFDYVDIRVFQRRIQTRLPRYKEKFEAAGTLHQLPWTLLAALAYQESHWNNNARSSTGVRGIMMLTRSTARGLGLQSRLDPEKSIEGGARYLKDLIKRLPKKIHGEDRQWIGLAAYNIGMAHILDSRRLALRIGKNPDKWSALKTVLPLLTQRHYYKSLRNGYARGTEAIDYVRKIRNYQDILEQGLISTQKTTMQPPKNISRSTVPRGLD